MIELVLFILFGLTMDLVHELGHAVWGTAAGGHLTYLKIAYFEIYPTPAITSTFVLGYVEVQGLTTNVGKGLFLLGGSLTTNLTAWLLALLLLRTRMGYMKQTALKTLGIFGILDLPFYVVFPQLGLQHWILLGGNTPEPMIGAQKIGMADPVFYALVTFTTVGLATAYSRFLRNVISRMFRSGIVDKFRTFSSRPNWATSERL